MSALKIIIVDDEDMVRSNLIAFFEDEGYDVFSAVTGEEALITLGEKTVDLGIIDMRLPGLDGNKLILKAHELNSEMKFIIHTGSADYILPKELIEIGITEKQVFKKPVLDMSILLECVSSLFSN